MCVGVENIGKIELIGKAREIEGMDDLWNNGIGAFETIGNLLESLARNAKIFEKCSNAKAAKNLGNF